MIDLRSDTCSRPTEAMRHAMAEAPVGDDQFGEDPTINELQSRVAALLGKEAALWLPSGTMANQVALRALTRPGDDVIVSRESHAVWHETGGGGANAGVQFTEIGTEMRKQYLRATIDSITENRFGIVDFPRHVRMLGTLAGKEEADRGSFAPLKTSPYALASALGQS